MSSRDVKLTTSVAGIRLRTDNCASQPGQQPTHLADEMQLGRKSSHGPAVLAGTVKELQRKAFERGREFERESRPDPRTFCRSDIRFSAFSSRASSSIISL